MELTDIAHDYKLNLDDFYLFLKDKNYPIQNASFFKYGSLVDDQVEAAVIAFKESLGEKFITEQEAKAAEAAAVEEERARQAELAQILVTSGFNFDGYTVTKYSGYISGDDVIEIPRGTSGIFLNATNVGDALSKSLVKIRRNALQELKEAAYDLGCNAIIGVDFDYITLEPETARSNGGTMYLPYVFCVTANGNAVVIEKDETK